MTGSPVAVGITGAVVRMEMVPMEENGEAGTGLASVVELRDNGG